MPELSGQAIKAYRERLQLSQFDFAALLELSQSLISMVEQGRNPVSKRLLRAMRSKADEGELQPSFDDFLMEEGGGNAHPLEREFGLVQPVILETWRDRLNLLKPADLAVTDRISLPGMAAGARAFRFVPAPDLISPDSIVAFRPATLLEITDGQVLLVQLRGGHLRRRKQPTAMARLGRAIVTGRGKTRCRQFESASRNAPIIELTEKNVEILMICFFRGRFCP